jgi:hypothetical protein
MSGVKADKRLSREFSSATRVSVLKSTAEAPAVFQTWVDRTEIEFQSRNLNGYLTGDISSTFSAPEPKFQWMVEMITVEIAPEDEGAQEQGVDDFDSGDEYFSAGALGATALPMETPAGLSEQAGRNAPTEPFFPRRSRTAGATPSSIPPGSKQSVQRCSPESEGLAMANRIMLAPSVEFYYNRLDGFRKLVSERESKVRLHDDKVSDAMELFKAAISTPVETALETSIATRNIHAMWVQLQQICGPKSSNEGLAKLDKRWANLTIASDETMTVFMQRMERLARGFAAFPAGFTKTDLHRAIIVREALQSSKLWDKLEFVIHDSEERKET